jgi:hypothetical protein
MQNWLEAEREIDERLASAKRSQKTTMDHRQGKRRRSLILVEIYNRDGKSAAGLIYNLSANGMFVVSNEGLDANECIDVVLQTEADTPIRIPGLVVHHSNSGFGLLFQHLDSAAHDFVEKHLG